MPNVTDQKTFFLQENYLEKGWYVILTDTILACKNARKKPQSQMNFVTPTKFKKMQISGIWLKKANLATLCGTHDRKRQSMPYNAARRTPGMNWFTIMAMSG